MAKLTRTPLGTKAYAIHKNWIKDKPLDGAKIIPCKLLTYVREGGKILQVYQSTFPGRNQLSEENYYIYSSLDEAVDAMKTKPIRKRNER